MTFSCLATHATVSTAISAIERTGTWKMEVRGNTKAELATVEQQLAALSRPATPRPAKTVREALAAERVPSGVWQDSQECGSIQESAYFARACAQVVQLRRELAAAQDYERLSSRAAELRKGLAEAPIVATSDPLPAAFNATLGTLRADRRHGRCGASADHCRGADELLWAGGAIGSEQGQAEPAAFASPGNGSPLARHQRKSEETTEAARDPAQGRSPEVAQVIHFPSARARRGPARPPPRMPSPSPPGRPRAGLGKLGPPAACPEPTGVALPQPAHGPAQGGAARVCRRSGRNRVRGVAGARGRRSCDRIGVIPRLCNSASLVGWPELKPNMFGMHLKVPCRSGWPQVQELRAGLRRCTHPASVARATRPERMSGGQKEIQAEKQGHSSAPTKPTHVVRPLLEGLPLFLGVGVEIVGSVTNALGLVVLDGITHLFRDPEAGHPRLDRASEVLRREGFDAQSLVREQPLDSLMDRVFAQDAIRGAARWKSQR